MHILLIEDEPSVRDIFVDACGTRLVGLTIAASLSEALIVIDGGASNFDLAICDLRIPTTAGALDEDTAHGLAALRRLVDRWSGVPVVVLSAFGTVDVVADMLLTARQSDLYGANQPLPMLRFVQKASLRSAVALLDEAAGQLQQIDQIELDASALPVTYGRALRIFARRMAGATVEYHELAGGRSGAKTGLATVRDSFGAQSAYAVAKLTTVVRAQEEKGRYRAYVAGRLGAATYADLSDEVLDGCGEHAGLFYSVADAFNRDLFSVLGDNDQAAAEVVARLAEVCAPWRADVPQSAKTWVDIRRNLIKDSEYQDVASNFDIVEVPDDRAVQCVWTSQHGDLHGANVLVDEVLRPVLIDFGRTGSAPSVLDPVTLELSATLHPDSPYRTNGWPTLDDVSNWADLDVYMAKCPYPLFIRACREWVHDLRVGQRELFATIDAFCLRNLQFDDVDKERTVALQHVAAARLNSL